VSKMSLDNVRKTIGDLLRLARNEAATQGEIDNALRFANRLMTAHHLTEDDIEGTPEHAAVMESKLAFASGEKLVNWEQSLASFVENFVGSVGVYSINKAVEVKKNGVVRYDRKGQPMNARGFVFYGPQDEARFAAEIFEELHQTISAMANLKYSSPMRGMGREYAVGFVNGLFAALEDGRRGDIQGDSQTRALVVRSSEIALQKKTAAKAWLADEQKIKLTNTTTTYSKVKASLAYKDGQADGKNARVGERSKKLEGGYARLN
jgi:hypothetical protein